MLACISGATRIRLRSGTMIGRATIDEVAASAEAGIFMQHHHDHDSALDSGIGGEPVAPRTAEAGAGGSDHRCHRGGSRNRAHAASDQHARARTRELLRARGRAWHRRRRSRPAWSGIVGPPGRPPRSRRMVRSTTSTPWSSPTRIPTTSAGRCGSTTRRVPRSSPTSRFAPCSTPPTSTIRRIPPRSTSTRPTIGPRRWSATSPSRPRGEGAAPGRRPSSSNGSAMPAARPASVFATPRADALAGRRADDQARSTRMGGDAHAGPHLRPPLPVRPRVRCRAHGRPRAPVDHAPHQRAGPGRRSARPLLRVVAADGRDDGRLDRAPGPRPSVRRSPRPGRGHHRAPRGTARHHPRRAPDPARTARSRSSCACCSRSGRGARWPRARPTPTSNTSASVGELVRHSDEGIAHYTLVG